MIDLHMHTFHSDGVLGPAELVRRAQVKGYQVMAITDHVDQSNVEIYVPSIVTAAKALTQSTGVLVLGGLEITHVPPKQIPQLIQRARALGAEVVVVHGETPVEPVAPGTNRAAIIGKADILAHPGLISPAEARLAKKNGVALELTSRGGHSLTNGHVARIGRQTGAALVVDSDTHGPGDILSPDLIKNVVLGAGCGLVTVKQCEARSRQIARRARY